MIERQEESYIARKITELSARTPFQIDLYQSQNTIRYYDLGLERVQKYTYKDKLVSNVLFPKLAIYTVGHLPIGGATSGKDRNLSLYELPMLLAYNYKAIYPFLIFIDGKAVPWSKVTVIRDYQDTFIAIDQEIRINAVIQTIVFPLDIRYGENDLLDPDLQGIYFDSDGYLCAYNLNDIGIRIEISKDTGYIMERHVLTPGMNTIRFWPKGYDAINVVCDSNKIFFEQGEDGKVTLSDKLPPMEHKGLGTYMVADEDYKGGDILFLTYDTHYPGNITHIDAFDQDIKQSFMQDFFNVVVDTNGDIGDNPLSDILDFDTDYEATDEENQSQQLRKILSFDYGAMKDLFIHSARVFSKEFTGKEINNWRDENDNLIFSRIRSNDPIRNDYVIVFQNGYLYNYYHRLKYVNAKVIMPVININDEDIITFVYFTKAMNDILDINITDRNRPYEISQRFTVDMELYSNAFVEPMVYEYNIDPIGTSFKVPINEIVEVEPHTYTFDLANDIYYNKDLKLVSKRQFRYMHFTNNCNISNVDLGYEFRYCQNPNQYLVFINGVKINRDNYALCFPGNTNPFKSVIIYFAAILDPDDSVDVFYLPEDLLYKEAEDLNFAGDIKIQDNYEIPYLSKHLQLFFINGALVSKSNISDINRNHVRIKNSKSIHSVVIIDTLDHIRLIAKLLATSVIYSYIFSGYKYAEELKLYHFSDIMEEYLDKEDRWTNYIMNMLSRVLDYMTKEFYLTFDNVDQKPFSEEPTEEEITHAKEIWDSIELPEDMNSLFGPELIEEIQNMNTFDRIFGKGNIQDLEDFRDDFDELKGAIYDLLFEQYILPYDIHTNSEFVFDYDNTSIDMEEYEENKVRQLTFTDASLYDKMYHYRMRKLTQKDFEEDIAAGDVPWKEGEHNA